jgi:ApaG protein
MNTKVTHGVTISVEVFYNQQQSNFLQNEFAFAYKIIMKNNSANTVQLLRRHWFIHDSNITMREVEGEGVVGQKPILHPGESYEYASGAIINTELGKMFGFYTFKNLHTEKKFEVEIPEFQLIAPFKMN